MKQLANKAFGFNNTKPVNFSKRLELGNVQDVENPNTGVMETGQFQSHATYWAASRTMTVSQRYALEEAGHEDRFQMVIRGRLDSTDLTHASINGKVYRLTDTSVDQRNYYDCLTILTLEDATQKVGG